MSDERYKAIFAKKLRYYMELNNKNQMDLMNDLNLGSSTVSSWCTGQKLPRIGKIQLLADYFGVNKSDLLEDKPNSTSKKTGVVINVLGRVAAGIPIEAVEDIIDTEEITQELAATGTYFGLQIKGNSMEPRMCEGDIVIVRQQEDAESGDIVIAMVNGDDATCKRLRKYRDGIELISNNPAYAPMFYSNEDIINKPVKIIGKVVELRGKF